MNPIKGAITKCEFETEYDTDGISYKDYVIIVDNKKYKAQIKGEIYLNEGMTVIMDIKPGTANEIIAGYCLKEGYSWGKTAGQLKKESSSTEKYEFIEGKVVEKKKSTSGSIYMNRSALSNRGSRVSYTILLENSDFHATRDEGEYLQVGMNIAAVLDKNSPVIIFDKDANRYLGLSKPYFIIFLLAIVAFNAYMYFSPSTPFKNGKMVLIVTTVFLALACLLSFATYRVTSSAKRFLISKLNVNKHDE